MGWAASSRTGRGARPPSAVSTHIAHSTRWHHGVRRHIQRAAPATLLRTHSQSRAGTWALHISTNKKRIVGSKKHPILTTSSLSASELEREIHQPRQLPATKEGGYAKNPSCCCHTAPAWKSVQGVRAQSAGAEPEARAHADELTPSTARRTRREMSVEVVAAAAATVGWRSSALWRCCLRCATCTFLDLRDAPLALCVCLQTHKKLRFVGSDFPFQKLYDVEKSVLTKGHS